MFDLCDIILDEQILILDTDFLLGSSHAMLSLGMVWLSINQTKILHVKNRVRILLVEKGYVNGVKIQF